MATIRTRAVVLAVVCLLALAGCAGLGADDAGDREETLDAGDEPPGADETEEANGGEDGERVETEGDGEFAAAAEDRALIRTGEVSLSVDSFAEASEAVRDAAETRDGYVSDSDERLHREERGNWTEGTLVVRVPAGEFDALLADVGEAGIVVDSSTESEDVTEELVDLEARVETKAAQRDRLTELYGEANETEEVLAIESELSDVQTEIERLEARQQSLEERVAYSTVVVHLAEPEPSHPEDPVEERAWYDTGVLAAFLASVEGVVTVLRAAVVGSAYLAPYLLAFGVPLAGVALVLRRREGAPDEPADGSGEEQ